MNVLNKKRQEALKYASTLEFDMEFIPGDIEELDMYKASHKFLHINCYGPTYEAAVFSARMEAFLMFMGEMDLIRKEWVNRNSAQL